MSTDEFLSSPVLEKSLERKIFKQPQNFPSEISNLAARDGIDTTIALGSNWDRATVESGHPELNLVSKMTAMTALLMYLSGFTKEVILVGGQTAGETNPSEAAAMKSFIDELTGLDVPFRLEEQSKDTVENAQQSRKLIAENEDDIGLIGFTNHIELRARKIFEDNGFTISETIHSDEMLKTLYYFIQSNFHNIQNSEFKRIFIKIRFEISLLLLQYNHFKNKPHLWQWYIQLPLRLIYEIDPEGRILTEVACVLRDGKPGSKGRAILAAMREIKKISLHAFKRFMNSGNDDINANLEC